ncbi:MAG TPA: LapA family protein [Solirubrobacterales bacterium]|nr:LapA family protein [Solirubrobacterales bacterium]
MATDPRQQPKAAGRREGTNWRHWFLGIALLLIVIVALQNSQDVEVEVLFIQTQAPLIAILLVTALLGAAIGYLLPVLRRHRREERRRGEG